MENILNIRCYEDEYKLEKYRLLQILKKEAERKLKSVSLYFSHNAFLTPIKKNVIGFLDNINDLKFLLYTLDMPM